MTHLYSVQTTRAGRDSGLEQVEEVIMPDRHRVTFDGGSLVFSSGDDQNPDFVGYGPGMWASFTSVVED